MNQNNFPTWAIVAICVLAGIGLIATFNRLVPCNAANRCYSASADQSPNLNP